MTWRADPMGLVGQTLDGQFRVDEPLGEGGFSVVYKGVNLGLDEAVAIKCLKLQASLGSAVVESFLRRFRDEGRILYKLSQGNLHIVRSIASGTTVAPATSSLVPYTILEWLEGRSLAQELEVRRAAGARGRPLAETLAMLDTAAQAIAFAHDSGVVHRDLNPGNIFLAETREGVRAKVLDFGFAKVVSDHVLELGPRAATMGQIRIFSPAYAAPEQFDPAIGKIAPWTDVYTFAVVLLEVLRDQPAVDGNTLTEFVDQTLDASRRPTPHALGLDVSPEVEAVFARALSLEPRDRFRDVGELWGTLKAAARSAPPVVVAVPVPVPVPVAAPAPADDPNLPLALADTLAEPRMSPFHMQATPPQPAPVSSASQFPALAHTFPMSGEHQAALDEMRRRSREGSLAPPAPGGSVAPPANLAATSRTHQLSTSQKIAMYDASYDESVSPPKQALLPLLVAVGVGTLCAAGAVYAAYHTWIRH